VDGLLLIIHTTLLAVCYSDMFQPSIGHPQGVQLIHFHSKIKNYAPDVKHKLLTKLNFTYGTNFVDLIVEMYKSHSWRMALSGLKHGITQS
jgi:hypothetical protein